MTTEARSARCESVTINCGQLYCPMLDSSLAFAPRHGTKQCRRITSDWGTAITAPWMAYQTTSTPTKKQSNKLPTFGFGSAANAQLRTFRFIKSLGLRQIVGRITDSSGCILPESPGSPIPLVPPSRPPDAKLQPETNRPSDRRRRQGKASP